MCLLASTPSVGTYKGIRLQDQASRSGLKLLSQQTQQESLGELETLVDIQSFDLGDQAL